MANKEKDYILFFFDQYLYDNYHKYLSKNDINDCFNNLKEFNLVKNKIILNVNDGADILNEIKLKEIKSLCSVFNEKYFYFFSGDTINGICFKFPFDFKIKNEINSKQLFYSFLSSYNNWMTNNWCRCVSGGHTSDIKIADNEYLDFSHELIIVKENNLKKILPIYEKYGKITPIIQHKEFLEKVFKEEFNYLLSDNIYITSNSIDYIKSQLS